MRVAFAVLAARKVEPKGDKQDQNRKHLLSPQGWKGPICAVIS